jgi:hypothetical protein
MLLTRSKPPAMSPGPTFMPIGGAELLDDTQTSKTNARARAKEKGTPRDKRKAPGRLVEGATVHGWRQALNALAITYPDRLTSHIN